MDSNKLSQLLSHGPYYPEKEFVKSGTSFADVYEMAGWLQDFFVRENSRKEPVCLAVDNKAIIAAAILASLGGGPPLLLPYAFSGRALEEMGEATGFTMAISDRERDFPPNTRIIRPEPGKERGRPRKIDIDGNAPLLRLFTGGSTGTPKSWLKTAGNLFGEAFYLAAKYRIDNNDLLIATVSPYHIYGLLFSVIIPLVSSATVLGDIPSFPAEIRAAVKENSATILAAVPAHYRALKGSGLEADTLRLAFSSAGMLDQDDNENFCSQNNISIVEVYGSTETGGIAARQRFLGERCFYPFTTVDWQINRERLLVKSAYISPGAARDNNGFFVTGDRVESGPDNCFFLKGRSDSVTKVGGKRVDLAEIRDKIKSLPGVSDCLVFPLADPGGRENMIAALVEGRAIEANELRTNLSRLLEPYALPRLVKNTDNIPLTANGKYDLAAIKQFFN